MPVHPTNADVLALNAGSSSIKFGLYRRAATLQCLLQGRVERIGGALPRLCVRAAAAPALEWPAPEASTHAAAAQLLLDYLAASGHLSGLLGVGHRVVHGLQRSEPEQVTRGLLDALRGIKELAPEHLSVEIALMEAVAQRLPGLPQLACFDTAFHRRMPAVATLLPVPQRLRAAGVQRYGFHGLSYQYLLEELRRVVGIPASLGRVILAHLGSGASLAALRGGECVDTSMGFTPASGLPMGTRTGDLDPGLAAYLGRTEGLSPEQFDRLVNHQCGLLGLSGSSADMQDLLEREARDPLAAQAVAFFCYQVRKWIGAYAAALGGLDTLVFSGGIGENAPAIRSRICEHLGFLGIGLDPASNTAAAAVLSTPGATVTVHLIHTNEELMIARTLYRALDTHSPL